MRHSPIVVHVAIIMVHGAMDKAALIESTDAYVKSMMAIGADMSCSRFEDGTHGMMGQKRTKTYPAMFKLFEKQLSGDK